MTWASGQGPDHDLAGGARVGGHDPVAARALHAAIAAWVSGALPLSVTLYVPADGNDVTKAAIPPSPGDALCADQAN